MKLLFSEAKADYGHYIFPYAVWAFPEPDESPADLFERGFLPSSRNLDRFYMCRQVRIDLKRFKRSSENRRILRKGEGIDTNLVPKSKFEYTPARREFFKTYADIKFGKDVMTYERLDLLFEGAITSHVLVFTETSSGHEVGVVTLYLQPNDLGYYYYAFYDLNYYSRNLGMFMMTHAINHFCELGYRYLYLGSCYLENALYKTQFSGSQFFNGVRWSEDLKELKYLIKRGKQDQFQHLLEVDDYRRMFYDCEVSEIGAKSTFRIKVT
ncbi:MAG TPA: GNAT family N-acetyltransferase [Patescibacteria group bacterium]|nr:GNAT family N-acetyltransferase [Patescibacteria group bacterium]